jgi:FkbM family methyltransferase
LRYYSQCLQDEFLNEYILKGERGGFFLDIGAHDGKSYSNSLFFEQHLDWKGICIEPNPTVFEILRENRNCTCLNVCASSKEGTVIFQKISGYPEMLSGIYDETNKSHQDLIQKELKEHGGSIELIETDSLPVKKILQQHSISKIHFCSIDTEGHEMEVLKSFDFNAVNIDVFVIENSIKDNSIKDFMKEQGYKYIITLEHSDEVFIKEGSPYCFTLLNRIRWYFSRRARTLRHSIEKRMHKLRKADQKRA